MDIIFTREYIRKKSEGIPASWLALLQCQKSSDYTSQSISSVLQRTTTVIIIWLSITWSSDTSTHRMEKGGSSDPNPSSGPREQLVTNWNKINLQVINNFYRIPWGIVVSLLQRNHSRESAIAIWSIDDPNGIHHNTEHASEDPRDRYHWKMVR